MNRNIIVKKNIIWSIFFKGIGFALSFAILPVTVRYLTEVEYGVWVTLFSLMNWVNILDLGIGLGVRNKLAEAVAVNDLESIKKYISTGMISMMCMGIFLIAIFSIGIQFVDIQKIFNTKEIMYTELYKAVFFTGTFTILSFSLSIINQFYFAYQKAAITGCIAISNSILLLIGLLYITSMEYHGLISFVLVFGISLVLSKMIFVGIFFIERRCLFPKWSYFRPSILKQITNLGLRFFLIQICGIFSFFMTNMLITQLLGPEFVRTYDITFKIFNFTIIGQNLILGPIWSAYTEAYALKDYKWIKRIYFKTNLIIIPSFICLIIISLFISDIVKIWMHINIEPPLGMLIGMVLFHMLSLIGGNCSVLLNGLGALKSQMISAMIMGIFTIPLTCVLVNNFQLGLTGFIGALTILEMLGVIVMIYHVVIIFNDFSCDR